MLEKLGAGSGRFREIIFRAIGRTLGPLCSVSGWLAPMYGAGFLESRNIVEYEVAARLAAESGHPELVACLLEMAEVEWLGWVQAVKEAPFRRASRAIVVVAATRFRNLRTRARTMPA